MEGRGTLSGGIGTMIDLSRGVVGEGVAFGALADGGIGAGAATITMDRNDGRQLGLAVGSMLGLTTSTALMAGSAVSPSKLWYLVDGLETIHEVARPNIVARGAMRAGAVGAMLGVGALAGTMTGIFGRTAVDMFSGG
jgi:hypothetical protein